MDNYEENCKINQKENGILLGEFDNWLSTSGLSKKTIENHVSNIEFYINDYLLYEDAIKAKDGVNEVQMFLGYWFIKKAMWASQSSIKSNATSLKKFYTFMHEKDLVSSDEIDELKFTIKKGMAEWLATLRRYDNPSIENVW